MLSRHTALMFAFLCVVCCVSRALEGQNVPAAKPADSSNIAATWYKGSMAHIVMSPADSAIAYRICLSSFVAQQRVPFADPARMAQLNAIDDRRDALILKLLTSGKDSAQYLANSARYSFRRHAKL